MNWHHFPPPPSAAPHSPPLYHYSRIHGIKINKPSMKINCKVCQRCSSGRLIVSISIVILIFITVSLLSLWHTCTHLGVTDAWGTFPKCCRSLAAHGIDSDPSFSLSKFLLMSVIVQSIIRVTFNKRLYPSTLIPELPDHYFNHSSPPMHPTLSTSTRQELFWEMKNPRYGRNSVRR